MKAFGLFSLVLAAICFAAPSHTFNVAVSADVSSEARVLTPRAETPDRGIPDNLFRVSVSYSEYCENGALKARGWLGNGQVNTGLTLSPTQVSVINLHPNLDLLIGPYSLDAHGFIMRYDGCEWTSEGGYPCGWCEQKPWSLDPLNCQTGQPANQRIAGGNIDFTSTTPTVEDVKAVAARDESYSSPPAPVNLTLDVPIDALVRMLDVHHHVENLSPTSIEGRNSTPIENVTFEMASATITPAPEEIGDSPPPTPAGNIIDTLGSTVVLMPAIIETHAPNAPQAQNYVVLPFHLSLWESCVDGQTLAAAVYTNGNMKQSLEMKPGLMISINHRVPGYPNLDVGPYDYAGLRVRFTYRDCEWFDNETWKSCGECRAALWSAGPLDCRDPRAFARTKEMDCSVLLGTAPILAAE